MPRPGAVTRSMTRSGVIDRPSASEQASHNADADLTARKDSILGSMTCSSGSSSTSSDFDKVDVLMSNDPASFSIPLADLLTHNRTTILRLEQSGALTPGVLKITSFGELQADLKVEPDTGTMAGLFPKMAPSPDTDDQIPSWVRDYLIKELDVHGHGPPASCRALYDHLQAAQEDFGINNSVRTTEAALAYATISLRYAIEEVRSFVKMKYVSKECYDEEVWVVIKNIKRLVGYEGEEMSMEVRMLVEIAEMGAAMKEAINEPLEDLIMAPYTRLLDRMELVSKALRLELDRVDTQADKAWSSAVRTPDSGIGGCCSGRQ